MTAITKAKFGVAASFAITVALFYCGACSSKPLTPAEKKAAAEGSYGGQIQQCIDKNPTWESADQCKARVDAEWSKKDAGAKP